MFRYFTLLIAAAALTLPAFGQEPDDHDKNLDVRSPIGDLHVGKDADASKVGLPLYPGARPQQDESNDPLNLGVFTESFGLKLVVAKYRSEDSPDKILAFYRDKMKKYGKVLECRGQNDNSDMEVNDEDRSKPLKCEGDNTGPVRELKVGTEGNAHIVAVEPKDKDDKDQAKGTTFTLVYLYKRDKKGEI
jgi:hypothetical protein